MRTFKNMFYVIIGLALVSQGTKAVANFRESKTSGPSISRPKPKPKLTPAQQRKSVDRLSTPKGMVKIGNNFYDKKKVEQTAIEVGKENRARRAKMEKNTSEPPKKPDRTLKTNRASEPLTPEQKKVLKDNGIRVKPGMTRDEALALLKKKVRKGN